MSATEVTLNVAQDVNCRD